MRTRTIATLPGAVRLLAPVHGTSTFLACTETDCFEIDAVTESVELFARLTANSFATGGGGWSDHVFIADYNGVIHERRGARGSGAPVVAVRPFNGEIRACAAAASVRRIACAMPFTIPQGFMPSDVLGVFDVTGGCDEGRCRQLLRYEPPSHDCFDIHHVAISPHGAWAGLTGHEMIYGSDYSPSSYVNEHACIVEVDRKDHDERARWWTSDASPVSAPANVSVFHIDESWRVDIVRRAIALGAESWFVDRHCLPPTFSSAEHEPTSLVDTPSRLGYMEATVVAALQGGGFAALASRMSSRRSGLRADCLVIGHPDEPAETDFVLLLTTPATSMIALEGTIVLGHDDGAILCVDRDGS